MSKRRLSLVFVGVLAIGLIVGGCGGDDGAETTPNLSTDGGKGSEGIVIKTRVHFPGVRAKAVTGEVLGGSSIGDSSFCPGGTFRDQHGNPEIGLVDRTVRCPDGSLRIGFTPGRPQGHSQTGPWKAISGTGAFEGLRGHGRMVVKYEPGDPSKGRETFTGTVVP
jgi:hypothetical protein